MLLLYTINKLNNLHYAQCQALVYLHFSTHSLLCPKYRTKTKTFMAPFNCVPYVLVKVKLERKWTSMELVKLLKWIETILLVTA